MISRSCRSARDRSAAFLLAVETEEGGRRETLEVGFEVVQVDAEWFLVLVQSGSEKSSLS